MIYRRMVNGGAEETVIDPVFFEKHYPVIVAGVGTAGVYAVLSAAQLGVGVLGIDRLSMVGGMGTAGFVSGYYYGLAGGLQTAIDEKAKRLEDELFLNPAEAKVYLFESMIREKKAELSLETVVTGVFLEEKTVRGISVFSRGKHSNLSCDILIDATADAAVCILAGCKTDCGRASDGKTRPFTSVKVFLDQKGKLSRTNHDSGYVDQYDPFALSEGILQAHASQLLEEFQSEEERILFFAPFIGIREGHLIEAEQSIGIRDVIAGKQEEEPLFYAYCDFDKHGKDNALETEELQDLYVASNLSTLCFSVPVTLGSMVPRGYRSILAAGRHIGMDHDVASLIRMKRDLQKCGESAGVCAALAVKNGVQPTEVDYGDIRKILQTSGCLTEQHNVGRMFDDAYRREKIEWLADPDKIKAALGTTRPGVALYSCKLLGDRIAPRLKEWMKLKDPLLRYGSAIALGLTLDRACLSLLREIVENRDAFYFEDCRRTNQFRVPIAIYLLGKLGDADSIPLLGEILCGRQERERACYHAVLEQSYRLNPNKNFNELYFQVISHSAVSLIKIIQKNPAFLKQGTQILTEAFRDNRHIEHTTALPAKTFEYEAMDNIKSYVMDFCGKNRS